MKKALLVIAGCALGLIGFIALLNLYYNVAGMFGLRDAASGTVLENGLVALACVAITVGGFFGSYRMFWTRGFAKKETTRADADVTA